MNDTLSALRVFIRVARTGSFSRAGVELGVPQPSVSRIVAALEREVGVALFARTTREVSLTEAGADYLARIEPILRAFEEANQAARGTGELKGLLRIGLPSSIANRIVIPILPLFIERHPSLRIELVNEVRWQDIVRERIDVALRFGVLADSSLIARPIGLIQRLLLASPEYLHRAGAPQTPAELENHSLIVGPGGMDARGWMFERQGRTVSLRVEGRIICNINESATVAAVAGLGILSTGEWGTRKEVASGALVRVLPEWKMMTEEFSAVLPAGRAAKPAVRAFIDHLVSHVNE